MSGPDLKTILLLSCISLGALCRPAAAPAATDSAARDARWREDLKFFAAELPAKQLDFFKLMPRAKFEGEMAGLNGRVPQLSDWEIMLEVKRIVAGLGVAHTMVGINGAATDVYPVRMQWFSDGLAVVSAAAEYRQALGARVLRIGSMTPSQVEAALSPYISHENEAWLHNESTKAMIWAKLLQHEKITGPDARLQLTLAKADGAPFTMDLTPPGPGAPDSAGLLAAEQELRIPPPLYRREFKPFYGYAWLPDARALYIQYNRCQDDPKKSFATFARELFAFSDSHPVQRVIVDLRFNNGGNSAVVQPLLDGLKSRPALHAAGHLYALIGGGTFSSGLMAAVDFQQKLRAILVGRPTGGKPNCYGEVKTLELPNSKLTVQYSIKHFRLMPASDPPSLEPDIPVPVAIADFLAGRDPDLEAALDH